MQGLVTVALAQIALAFVAIKLTVTYKPSPALLLQFILHNQRLWSGKILRATVEKDIEIRTRGRENGDDRNRALSYYRCNGAREVAVIIQAP
jgi:hypothetical protein